MGVGFAVFVVKFNKMPTEIYQRNFVYTLDNEEIEIIPLKIKYMKEFMDAFEHVKLAKDDDEVVDRLCECARVAMKQYHPKLSKSIEDIQENFTINTLYELVDYSAGIKINPKDDPAPEIEEGLDLPSWQELDLAKLETEVFLLGIWKSYDELESSISIQELMSIISGRRELDYEEKKFAAALQGVDLDEAGGGGTEQRGQKEWEDLKARVYSKGATSDSNDILALQGQNAAKAGFGIGMGLDYERVET
jgi:hypothetical protein